MADNDSIRYFIDHKRVRASFSNAVASYNENAVLQKEVADRLIERIAIAKIKPRRILDIGCGTGFLTQHLRRKFRQADVVALDCAESMLHATRQSEKKSLPWHGKLRLVNGDATQLPFADHSFDLVCSNLTMQWVPNPQEMLAEMLRVTSPDGLNMFTTFGRRTLIEMRECLAKIDKKYGGLILPFPDVTTLGNSMMALSMHMPVTDSDIFTLTYADTYGLFRDLKKIGASAAAIQDRPQGLYGPRLLRALDKAYRENHSSEDGRIYSSFEVLYAQAWKSPPTSSTAKSVFPPTIQSPEI